MLNRNEVERLDSCQAPPKVLIEKALSADCDADPVLAPYSASRNFWSKLRRPRSSRRARKICAPDSRLSVF